jgi:formylglycine-generating enzyme required for sulfatase activity
MHGNVFEWCSDYYDKGYYSNSPSVDPNGPSSGISRCLRGGSWFILVGYLRSFHRYGDYPGFRHCGVGFRVVCSEP